MSTRRLILHLICTVLALPLFGQSLNLKGIAHVALRVTDLQKSQLFYERLGFQTAFELDGGGEPSQVFLKVNDRQFLELYPLTQAGQAKGLMHICYESADLESLRSAFVSGGLNPTPVKKAKAGNLLSVLHDADEQLVEFTQYLPGSLHWQDRGKHLGENRISYHLHGATIVAKDVAAVEDFYSEKLGFRKDASHSQVARLRVPGSGDELSIMRETSEVQPEIAFAVENTQVAAKALAGRGFDYHIRQGALELADPDGNRILFIAIHSSITMRNARRETVSPKAEPWELAIN